MSSSANSTTGSLLGFGDLRGYYDFDTMASALDKPQLATKHRDELINTMMLSGHETNHWFQQISTSFGNFSSMQRFQLLLSGRSIWYKLSESIRNDLLAGVIRGPFHYVLRQGQFNKEDYNHFDKNDIADVDYFCKKLPLHKYANHGLETVAWITSTKPEIKNYYTNTIAMALLLMLIDQQKKFPELLNFTELNQKLSGSLLNEVDNSEDLQKLVKDELWDVTFLLEASCIVQEIHKSESLFPENTWAEQRIRSLLKSNYLGPIKHILRALGLELRVNTIRRCAGLITHIIEVALNPDIPPHFSGDFGKFTLCELHPSLRFARLTQMMGNIQSSLKSFSEFSDIQFANWEELNRLYSEKCCELADLAGLSFRHRLKQDYMYGENTFNSSKTVLRDFILSDKPDKGKITSKLPVQYQSMPAKFILDAGYNAPLKNGMGFQNNLMLHRTFYESGQVFFEHRKEFLKNNFDNFLNCLAFITPLILIIDGEFRPSQVFGVHATQFTALNHFDLARFHMMFSKSPTFSFSNIPFANQDSEFNAALTTKMKLSRRNP